mmetsp:Transcript_43365/g.101747  ORF Transcript_43365/g.101747 Transcript_43365/m.101747 type:complete len:237 (-) Transcript_43365:25-735(-)
MSFQDMMGTAGRGTRNSQSYGGGSFRPPEQNSQRLNTIGSAAPGASNPSDGTVSMALAALSEGIVQYQNNLGILSRIAEEIGTKADNRTVQSQYKTQVDVIEQLSKKIEYQFTVQEDRMKSMSRIEASKCRTTHLKLNRDYRQVQSTYRNLTSAVRRKQELVAAQMQDRENKEKCAREGAKSANQLQLNMRMQEEALDEQIMRERETEIRHINKSMHQVNEIFKVRSYLLTFHSIK